MYFHSSMPRYYSRSPKRRRERRRSEDESDYHRRDRSEERRREERRQRFGENRPDERADRRRDERWERSHDRRDRSGRRDEQRRRPEEWERPDERQDRRRRPENEDSERPDDRQDRSRRPGDREERRERSEKRPRFDHQDERRPIEHPSSLTVWIGSVPENEEAVFDAMSEFGTIGGMRIIHQRGFGYVRFLDVESAHKAVHARSADVSGRKIRIDSCEDMPTLPHPYRPVPGSKPLACTTLFVGNLPGDASEDEIMSYFKSLLEPVGILVQSVSLRKGGVKGLSFAHVRFANGQDCEQAVACVAGGRIRGTRIRIDWAVDKPGIQERSTMNAELRGRTNKIFIAGLNDNVLDNDVMQAFGGFGEITSLRLNRDKAGVRSFGYITFSSPDAASAAMDHVASIQIPGVKLRADFAKPDRPPAGHVEAPSRGRSPSPDYPRFTPVSYAVPPEYGPMRSWIDCYGKSMVGGSF